VVVPKTLSYADAVKLLGGQDSKAVTALDRATGGLLLAAVPFAPAVIGWFDARAEFVRLGHELVRAASERRSGLSRHTRTRRIEAAHAVLVVTAFFEALAEADLPFAVADLALTRQEQEALARRAAGDDPGWEPRRPVGPGRIDRDPERLAHAAAQETLWAGVPLPGPAESTPRLRKRLANFYLAMSSSLQVFVANLDVVDRLGASDREALRAGLRRLPRLAGARYEDLAARLAVDFPEVAWWAGSREHEATRAELGAALAGLSEALAGISTGRAPDERRAALARAYRAALDRPVVEASDAPQGLRLPTLAEAYVEPVFRAAEVVPYARPSDQRWWGRQPVRGDLDLFLRAHLTSPRAAVAPLLVLGQPGSGKSMLTKVLAARLPAEDFLPVRVVLRDVPADADVQDQIEHAVRAATGERLEWPALARSAGDALPVVLLDGFDELLQATGVSQTDYLVRIARFQRREADQGRPLAVVVTSRTSVADRARPPEETVALLLEPFDDERVAAWLARWNAVNAGRLAARGLDPLDAATVLAHRDLAGQPLLLLMLALYDADGNALQRTAGSLRRGELYERLLNKFAEREVTKHLPGRSDRDLALAVEEELRRLSVVAFAMFNRGSQWVTETDLDADLLALFGRAASAAAQDLRGPLGPAETVLGRFFFIHRSQASRDDARLQTYEFLHATFGEFLVARLAWLVLLQVAAREAASTFTMTAAPTDDDLLHALLSFTPVSARAPVLGFLQERAAGLTPAERAPLVDMLVRLFRAVHEPRPARGYAGYQPRRLGVPARHAAYSVNLVLLATYVGGEASGRDLFGPDGDRAAGWHAEALLWRSQLSSEHWSSVVDALSLLRVWDGEERDVRLRPDAGLEPPGRIDPRWTYGGPPPGAGDGRSTFVLHAQHLPRVLYRKGAFQCGHLDDVVLHALAPLADHLGEAIGTFHSDAHGDVHGGDEAYTSAAHALLDAWLLPTRQASDEDRRRVYERCASIVAHSRALPDETWFRYAVLLLERLSLDDDAAPGLVADVLQVVGDREDVHAAELTRAMARCALRFLGRGRGVDGRIADAFRWRTLPMDEPADRPVAEIYVALVERRRWTASLSDRNLDELALWPDLATRLEVAVRSWLAASGSDVIRRHPLT
jgi:hypothetical protein